MATIREGCLDDPRMVALLAHHVATARSETARCSAHALDLDALRDPTITVWSAWDGEQLLGVGALKRLSATHGEIKSMHVAEGARRTGVGQRIVEHIVREARAGGLTRLSLETGSGPYFAPARALYRAAGFEACEPFGAYVADENSVFMTRTI